MVDEIRTWLLAQTSQLPLILLPYLTRMQDDSKVTFQKKKAAKKKYFTITFIHLIHKACPHSVFLYHIVSLSPSSQSVLSSPLHPLLIFPTSSLPFHNISSSVLSTALDIQHFLKLFSFLLVRCTATLRSARLNTTVLFLGL